VATAQESHKLDRVLGLEIVRVTEATAIAAARLRGRGDEAAADAAAINAMYRQLSDLPIQGVIVVGEGEESEAPLLYIGETVGAGSSSGLEVDIAVDPVEGSTLAAKALPNALSVMAIAERGSLLKVPTLYMDKIAIGPGYAQDLVDLDASPADNLNALARAKGVPVTEITACILDRPRHAKLIEDVRAAGAAVRLIGDGDIAGVIHTTEPQDTGIDIYMGVGGAPEGVLAAAALCCIGGQIQGRLIATNAPQRERARAAGHRRPRAQIHHARHGCRRCHLRCNRHHRRLASRRRALEPEHDFHPFRGHAGADWHRALDQDRISRRGRLRLSFSAGPANQLG